MIIKIGYINLVTTKGPLADYFERNYLDYQRKHGLMSLGTFAKALRFSRAFLSQLLEGKRTSMSYHTARYVADVLHDYEILEILNYPMPSVEERDPFFGYPPEIVEALKSARDKVATRGVADSSPEGRAIYSSEIEKVLKSLTTSTDESAKM